MTGITLSTVIAASGGIFACLGLLAITPLFSPKTLKPNFVIFFADDFGWGDLSVYGHPTQEWGPVDNMAVDGMRFTSFYTAYMMCTPSRAALLTGRLPIRMGLYSQNKWEPPVYMPQSVTGLPLNELTIAEALRDVGYKTAIVGKWHLGINKYNSTDGTFLPSKHGFDFVGTILPFTNFWSCDQHGVYVDEPDPLMCFIYRGDAIIQQPINFDNLTDRFVDDAKEFIEKSQNRPFFLYFPLAHTHTELTVMPRFRGSSLNGKYGDNVQEMQWAIGEIIRTLNELKLAENTLVLFISDHGPQKECCLAGGSSGIFKGAKHQTWEGGVRVPAVAWWPSKIAPRQVSSTVLTTMDIFPTLLELAGADLPQNITLDGKSLTSVLFSNNKTSPHEIIFFYCHDIIMAVRYGSFKVHFYTQDFATYDTYLNSSICIEGVPQPKTASLCFACEGDCVTEHKPPVIYNIDVDPGEKFPLDASTHLKTLEKISELIKEHKNSVIALPPIINEDAEQEAAQPCCNPPSCRCNYP